MVAPLFAIFLIAVASSFFMSYIPIRLERMDINAWFIGFIGSIYYVGMLLGTHLSVSLIVRVGHIRTYALLASIVAAATLLQSVYYSAWLWIAVRFIWGYGLGTLYLAIESWFFNISDETNKGAIIAIYTIILSVGAFIAQLGIRFITDFTATYPFIFVSMLTSLSIVPITWTRSSYPTFDMHESSSILKVFKKAPTGILNTFGSGVTNSILYSMYPALLSMLGFQYANLSNLLAIPMLGGVILQYPIGRVSDFIDRRKILVILHILSALLIVLIILLFSYITTFMILLFFLGGVCFSMYPISMANTCDVFDKKDYLLVIHTLLIVYSLGTIVGPMVASSFLKTFGPWGVLIAILVFNVLIGVYTYIKFINIIRRIIGKTSFISTPKTTPLVAKLDPRTEDDE